MILQIIRLQILLLFICALAFAQGVGGTAGGPGTVGPKPKPSESAQQIKTAQKEPQKLRGPVKLTPESTWQEILSHKDIEVPGYFFSVIDADGGVPLSILDVCFLNNDILMGKVEKLKAMHIPTEVYKFFPEQVKMLKSPVPTAPLIESIRPKAEYQVYRRTKNNEYQFLFFKSYTIPNCPQI